MFEKIFIEILINHRGKRLNIFYWTLFSILVITIDFGTVFIMVCTTQATLWKAFR